MTKLKKKVKINDEALILLYAFHNKTEIEEFHKLPSISFDRGINNLFKVLGLKYSKKELKRLQK